MEKKKVTFLKLYLVLFVVLNIMNAFLLITPNIVDKMHLHEMNLLMITGSIIGNMAVIGIFIGIGMLLFRKEKSFGIYLLIVTGVLSIFCFGLGIFTNYYGMMFGFDSLATFGTKSSGDSFLFVLHSMSVVIQLSAPIFFLALLLMTVGYIILRLLAHKQYIDIKTYPHRKIKLGLTILLASLFVVVGINGVYYNTLNATIYKYDVSDQHSIQYQGVYSHYLGALGKKVFPKKILSAEDKNHAFQQINDYYQTREPNSYTGIFSDRNLLLIQMESVNNFLIGLKVKDAAGEMHEITPNLNKMAREGYYFRNFYTSVGIGNTSDAEFAVMTGLYPSGPRYTIFTDQNNKYETLPNMFKEDDYAAISLHGNTKNFYNREENHVKIFGFDQHFGREDMYPRGGKELEYVGQWISDEELFRQSVWHMKNEVKNGKKVFCFPITVSNHTPFEKPKTATSNVQWFNDVDNMFKTPIKLDKKKSWSNLFTGYLEYVHYTDFAIGCALAELEKEGLLDSTVIMCYGDHGIVAPIYDMFYYYQDRLENDMQPLLKKEDDVNCKRLAEARFLDNIPFIIYAPDIISSPLPPKTFDMVRSETSIKSTVANLFALQENFSFNKDCFREDSELCYNPKTGIIYVDNMTVGHRKQDCHITGDDKNLKYERLDVIKRFNDKKYLNDIIREYNLESKYLSR